MSSVRAEGRLWDILRGALVTRTLAIVADLHVADALAEGPRSAEELASELGADADALHRCLRALASDGVFAEEDPGVFRNTPASELLRQGSGWADFAHLFGGIWHRSAGELDATGAPTFARAFGADFWSWLAEHPEERAAFDNAMAHGTEGRVERLAALDWSGDETVVDVGGGNGALMVELVRRLPSLHAIVFDLPETDRDESSFGERVSFAEGSFFEGGVPEGDAYVLGTVLHDWPDEDAATILRTIRACAPSQARVLVIDAVIPPGNEPHGAKWLDLHMLALFGARERDETQWRALLEGVGLEVERIEDGLVEARVP